MRRAIPYTSNTCHRHTAGDGDGVSPADIRLRGFFCVHHIVPLERLRGSSWKVTASASVSLAEGRMGRPMRWRWLLVSLKSAGFEDRSWVCG
ncbi:hypothetical protein M413DRAFT_239356 [Hebeloma cylindrosporum]|uniref:Uncharacterized protein n=1 Tax=Hebeloma cylindrosporum TaxID=76867 RepID=A0A0C2XMI1_HEBCY|nr:hypothetical protein M413DRAFT_239356 [Hebeloma cylindrosporum h7]